VELGRAGYSLREGATSRKQFYSIYGALVRASPMEGMDSESKVISRDGAAAAMSLLVFETFLFESDGRVCFTAEAGSASH